jgi:hypothetical protein
MSLLTDDELDALDSTMLYVMAPRERDSVREYGRAVESAILSKVVLIVEQTADDPVEQTRIIDAIRRGDV